MFELHITCTKDIDKIQIDFSDGTSCISESKHSKTNENTDAKNGLKTEDNYANGFSRCRDEIQHYEDVDRHNEIVQKPDVPDVPKEPNVEEYLHGLNF